MVGRVTLLTPTAGLPPGRKSFPDVSAYSGPATGCGSGAAPGQIGTCVCPGDGCQVVRCCALKLPNADTTPKAKSKGFIHNPQRQDRANDARLTRSLRLGQHHSRLTRRRLVKPHHPLRLPSLIL